METKTLPDLIYAKNLLIQENYTCVLCKGSSCLPSRDTGVKPLLRWLADGSLEPGYCAADRVAGRAAAYLYVLLQVRSVYSSVISEGALEIFKQYGISASYETLVPAIMNRTNTGYCPMEIAVTGIDNPEDALAAVKAAVQRLASEARN